MEAATWEEAEHLGRPARYTFMAGFEDRNSLLQSAKQVRDTLASLKLQLQALVHPSGANSAVQGPDPASSLSLRLEGEPHEEDRYGNEPGDVLSNSTLVIIGALGASESPGSRLADFLVRAGIRKLILFDERDASTFNTDLQDSWEGIPKHAQFELESYVDGYVLDEETVDHVQDRLSSGKATDTDTGLHRVDLVVIFTSATSTEAFNLVFDQVQTFDIPLITVDVSSHHVYSSTSGHPLSDLLMDKIVNNILM